MTVGERLKAVRKFYKLTLEKFGDKVGVTSSSISDIEKGRRELTKQMCISVCREYDVNETWLRTGEGDMFVAQSREDEIERAVRRLLSGETEIFKRRLILTLSNLPEEHWAVLEEKLLEIAGVNRAQPETRLSAEEEAKAESEEVYRQILEEKRAKGISSASPPDIGKMA